MLSGLFVFLSGAKRWLNAEAVKALAAVAIVIVLTVAAAFLFGAGQSAGGAKRDATWLQKLNAAFALQAKRQARQAVATADAAAKTQAEAEQRAEAAVQRAAVLAAEVARLKGEGRDTEVFTADERERLLRK